MKKIKQMKRILGISTIAFLLVGCQLFPQSQKPVIQPPVDIVQPPDEVIESPPQMTKTTDWSAILSPFVDQVLQSSSSYAGNKVILISDIQNRSGDYIATSQVDTILHSLMNQQNSFAVVDRTTISQAKQALGISYDDKLVSRSKMIALAKSINVDYVLFTTIYKVPKDDSTAEVSMELILTKTGEILERVTSAQIAKIANTDVEDAIKEAIE